MLHNDRQRAESFGADPERYDRSRPSYSPAVIDFVLGDTPTLRRVLDVGCGTGIASRLMSERGADVLGIEPDARMAEFCRRRGTRVDVAAFESWEPQGRTFNAVTAFQAWHWVNPLRGANRAAEVLESGGTLHIVWNVARPPRDLAQELDGLYVTLAPGLDAYSVLLGGSENGEDRHDPRFTEAERGVGQSEQFGDPTHHLFEWSRPYTSDEWTDQLPTHSDHAALAPQQLEELLAAVRRVIETRGNTFVMNYRTTVLRTVRR